MTTYLLGMGTAGSQTQSPDLSDEEMFRCKWADGNDATLNLEFLDAGSAESSTESPDTEDGEGAARRRRRQKRKRKQDDSELLEESFGWLKGIQAQDESWLRFAMFSLLDRQG